MMESGCVALEAAARRPELFAKVVLWNPGLSPFHDLPSRTEQWLDLFLRDRATFSDALSASGYLTTEALAASERRDQLESSVLPNPWAPLALKEVARNWQFDSVALADVICPVEILYRESGPHAWHMAKTANNLCTDLANASSVVVPGRMAAPWRGSAFETQRATDDFLHALSPLSGHVFR
jgi:pimeloyl-ACP methyl ester carboxylesterase